MRFHDGAPIRSRPSRRIPTRVTRPGHIAARLVAAALTIAASLPGRLQLVHRHAGDEHGHTHTDAEHLAVRDLIATHAHPHSHPHAADGHDRHGHAAAPGDGADGPALGALDSTHVHDLDPFQQAARSAVLPDTVVLARSRAAVPGLPPPPERPDRAARSRGPPTILAG